MNFFDIPEDKRVQKYHELLKSVLIITHDNHWLWPRKNKSEPTVQFYGLSGNITLRKFLWLHQRKPFNAYDMIQPTCKNQECFNPDHCVAIGIDDRMKKNNRKASDERRVPYDAEKQAPPKKQEPMAEEQQIIKHNLPNGNYIHLNLATKGIDTNCSVKQINAFLNASYRVNDQLYMPEIIRHYYRLEFEIEIKKTESCWEYTGPKKRFFKPMNAYIEFQRRATFLYKLTNRIGSRFKTICNNALCVNPAHIIMIGMEPIVTNKDNEKYIDTHLDIIFKPKTFWQRVKSVFSGK